MTQPGGPITLIRGQVVHKTSNALKITFADGPGDPLAIGVQGGNDGRGKKLATLFGFKNGGTGNHVLTYADGSTIQVASRDSAPTVLTRADGTEVATIHRGAESSAVRAGGGQVLTFGPDPDEAETPDLYRMVVADAAGEQLGQLDIVRKVGGWTLARAIDEAWNTYVWWDQAGQALPIPILGTRFLGRRALTAEQREILLAACIDIAIGLRPYIDAMR
jgi:hypothetical protein